MELLGNQRQKKSSFRKALSLVLVLAFTGSGCAKKYLIKSDPTEANVYVNDKLLGVTPLSIRFKDYTQTAEVKLKVEKEGVGSVTAVLPDVSSTTLSGDILVTIPKTEPEESKINRLFLLYESAQELAKQRRFSEALRVTDTLIGENPRYIFAQNLRGSILFLSHNYLAAEGQWKKVLEIDPANKEAVKMLDYLKKTAGANAIEGSASYPAVYKGDTP
jgi:tetratricopeptide (TPR) repeat protein